MSRRSYTDTQLRALVIAQLRDELGSDAKVSSLPPPEGLLQPDQVQANRVYIGIPGTQETVYDARRDRQVATTTDCSYTVRVQHYTRRVTAGLADAYDAHLTLRRTIIGRLARLVDDAGETVPVQTVQSGTIWTGEYWATTIDASVRTRAPTA